MHAGEEDAIKLVHAAYDAGVRLFNTSDLYGPYTNEQMLGKALAGEPCMLHAVGEAAIARAWRSVSFYLPVLACAHVHMSIYMYVFASALMVGSPAYN